MSLKSLDKEESKAEFVFQDWVANWKTPSESSMPQVDPDLGGNFVQGNTVQGRENEETEEVQTVAAPTSCCLAIRKCPAKI